MSNPPPGATHFIFKNDKEDWSMLGIEAEDKVYYKLVSYFDPFCSKKSPLGDLYFWSPIHLRWVKSSNYTIDNLSWNAVDFKVYPIPNDVTTDLLEACGSWLQSVSWESLNEDCLKEAFCQGAKWLAERWKKEWGP